jgi:hypothetical protein
VSSRSEGLDVTVAGPGCSGLAATPTNLGIKLAILVCLLLFGAEFILRGPARYIDGGFAFNDFISPLVQSNAWVKGMDPYSPRTLVELWPRTGVHWQFLSAHASAGTLARENGIPSPYPISCFVILAPLSLLSWQAVFALMAVANLGSVAALVVGLGRLAGLRAASMRAYLFLALVLGWAPLHTAIATANLIVVAFALAVTGMYEASRRREISAGLLLGMATCLKPQVGLVFIAYYLLHRRWRAGLTGLLSTGLVGLAAWARLMASHCDWTASYSRNFSAMFGPGGINDFSGANVLSFQLLNLQVPMHALMQSVAAANWITWSISGVLLMAWIALTVRPSRPDLLLDMATVVCIALLPAYHRFVDASVLLLPLVWCLSTIRTELRRIAHFVLALLLLFLVPGATILAALAASAHVPQPWASTLLWRAGILPHESWALVILSVAMLYAMHLNSLDHISQPS